MSSIAEMIRQADERLRTQINIAAGLAEAAQRLDEIPSPDDATVARQVLDDRKRALEEAQRRVEQLDRLVQHLSRVMRFRPEGWADERARLEQAISEDAQDGLASWLNYWFAAASSRRIGALQRLQADVTLPPAASVVAERMAVATRALVEKDWQLCHEVLQVGGNGVQIGPRQVPDRQAQGSKEPDDPVREDLRLLVARLALRNGLPDQAEAILKADGQNKDTAPRLALRACSARLRRDGPEAESRLREARELEPRDLDVAAESIAQARQHGEPDTALDYARSAVEALLSLTDVDGDLGRLVDPPAELWFAVAERAWEEDNHDVARRFLDRAAAAAGRDDDEIMAAIGEKRADFSASETERRRALISAGARRTGLGQLEQARRDYEAAASGQPADTEDGRVQASARLRWADVVSAIARQRPYRDLAAELEDILSRLHEAQEHVDVSGAESWSYLTESDLRIQLSRAQDRTDRYAQERAALLAAARAVALNPAWARPWLTLADIAGACRLYQVAKAAARRAHELGGDQATRAGYVRALIRLGLYQDALGLLGNEGDAWSRCVRGQVAMRLGQADEAIEHFVGVTIGRTWYWAWYAYIRALVIVGDLTAARLKSEEFMTAVADRKGERAWLQAAAFDACLRGELDAALKHAKLLLQAAGPDDVKARQVMGETRLLAGDQTGWELLASGLAEDSQPKAIEEWNKQERPVLDALAAAMGIDLEFDRLYQQIGRVRTGSHPGGSVAELRRMADMPTASFEAAKAARLTEAALRATGAVVQKPEDLLLRLAAEDELPAEAESLRRYSAGREAQDAGAAGGHESADGQDAPDDLPVLLLRLPASWLREYAEPGREHQLLVRYVPALRQRKRAVPQMQVAAGDELEPDGYQILARGTLLSGGRVDPGVRYGPVHALPLLPERVRTDPRTVTRDYGLDVPAGVPGSDRGLTTLLTISAAEVVALLYADAVRSHGILYTAPDDEPPRWDEYRTRSEAAVMQATLNVNELAFHRWEMRGRPAGSQRDADADWDAAQSLRHRLTERVAYFHWVERGQPFWDSLTDWVAAETAIASGRAARDELPGAYVVERLRHQLIEELAYLHWLSRGQPSGDSWLDWSAAEAEVAADEGRAAAYDAYAGRISADWLQALRLAFAHS